MSRNDLEGTTSRRAIILGMTNTDQIGFWQATPRSSAAEVLPDAGDGGGSDDGGGEDRNENGLTAAEQAEFDAMRTGGEAPAAGDEVDTGEGDVVDDGDDGEAVDAEPDPAPAARKPGEKEAAAPDQQQQRTPKTVNYSKYQRELKKVNEAKAVIEAQLAQERANQIKLATRLEMINEALQQPQQQQQPQPEAPQNPFEEPDIDPMDDFAGSIAQINRRQRFQLEQQNQVTETFQETREEAALKDTFTRDFASYAARDPSIVAAYQHLKDARLTQICIAEFDKDPNDPNEQFTPQEVQRMVQMFNDEEKWLVSKAIKEKRSPAAAIMRMAKTFGFNPEAPVAAPPAASVPAKRPPAPAAPAARSAPQQPDAMAQLEQLRKNQEDARSLSDGGGAPPQGLTAEMLLRLGDEEFAELVDSLPPHQLNQLMGRVPM